MSKFKLNVLSPSFQAQSQHTTTNHNSQRKLGALQLQLSVYLAAVHLSVELISAADQCGSSLWHLPRTKAAVVHTDHLIGELPLG